VSRPATFRRTRPFVGDGMTEDQLKAIMPALAPKRRAALAPFLRDAMTEFGISTPRRTAAFLAQLAHESGQLQFMEEIWGPTEAQRRYEPVSTLATHLGNIDAGDGERYKGRGPIQLTGRANYRIFGDALGVDLVADPARAALPDLAFRIAGLFWQRNGLNELADAGTAESFRQITRRINGGFNGLAHRQRFYAVACEVLGVTFEDAALPARAFKRRIAAMAVRARFVAFVRGAEAIRRWEASTRTSGRGPRVPKRRTRGTAATRPRNPSKPR
jgi:putative chitinase